MANQTYGRYSESSKKGCPTCDGVDPISCSRCQARSRLRDWVMTDTGWTLDKYAKNAAADGSHAQRK